MNFELSFPFRLALAIMPMLLVAEEKDLSPNLIYSEPSSIAAPYSAQYYHLERDFGIFLTLDFLYWHAHEKDLVWGIKEEKSLHLHEEWSPGIRIGIGKNLALDGWDLWLNWLYIHNIAKASSQLKEQEALFNPWAYSSWFSESLWQSGKADWQLNFDVMDFELGRRFWLGSSLLLRPFGGFRGTWMHTRYRISTNSYFPGFAKANPQYTSFFEENINFIRNNYWGVGLHAGIQPNWAIWKTLFVFLNCSGSLVWGRFFGSNVAKASFQGALLNSDRPVPNELFLKNHEKEGLHRMQAMLDLALGLHWEEYWWENRFSSSLEISWEYCYWPNFGLRHQTARSDHRFYLNQTKLVTDLILNGLVVRARVDF